MSDIIKLSGKEIDAIVAKYSEAEDIDCAIQNMSFEIAALKEQLAAREARILELALALGDMSDREQLVREAEALAEWIENSAAMERAVNSISWRQEQAAIIRRLLSLLPKEGEVVVPVEPTKKMMEYYYRAYETAELNQRNDYTPIFHIAYKAMIEARPK